MSIYATERLLGRPQGPPLFPLSVLAVAVAVVGAPFDELTAARSVVPAVLLTAPVSVTLVITVVDVAPFVSPAPFVVLAAAATGS